jgi:hypothetical protein
MADVFPTVLRDPIDDTNTLLVAGDRPASSDGPEERVPLLPPGLRRLATEQASRTGPRLPGGPIYTDDRAPVEWLVDRSILGYAAAE